MHVYKTVELPVVTCSETTLNSITDPNTKMTNNRSKEKADEDEVISIWSYTVSGPDLAGGRPGARPNYGQWRI